MSSENPAANPSDDSSIGEDRSLDHLSLDQEVSDVAIAIQVTAQRYTQLEAALEKRLSEAKATLKVKAELKGKSAKSSGQQLKLEQDIKVLSQQIDSIRTTLSNELLALTLLQGVKELFWQVVRFGGVGFLMGWVVRSMGG